MSPLDHLPLPFPDLDVGVALFETLAPGFEFLEA